MRVLAIDPGYDRLGVAVLEKQQGKEVLLHSTCITTNKSDSIPDRLLYLGTIVNDLYLTYKPTATAVETLFFNKNQKTAVGVAEVRGMLIYLAKVHQTKVFEYGPQEIKVAVTGYGKSDKTSVIAMVTRLIANAPVKALDDEYDAIALGITCLAHQR